jgi:hypothetical protein
LQAEVQQQQRPSDVLSVSLSYGSLKVEFSGPPEQVLSSLNSFIAKEIPAFNLANRIALNYTVQDLISAFGDLVKVTPEGPRVWHFERKLSDKELIGLQLVGAKIAAESGTIPIALKGMTLAELQSSTGLYPKSISSRLSEMTKIGSVERDSSDPTARYKITTQGVAWLRESLAKKRTPRVRAVDASGHTDSSA